MRKLVVLLAGAALVAGDRLCRRTPCRRPTSARMRGSCPRSCVRRSCRRPQGWRGHRQSSRKRPTPFRTIVADRPRTICSSLHDALNIAAPSGNSTGHRRKPPDGEVAAYHRVTRDRDCARFSAVASNVSDGRRRIASPASSTPTIIRRSNSASRPSTRPAAHRHPVAAHKMRSRGTYLDRTPWSISYFEFQVGRHC